MDTYCVEVVISQGRIVFHLKSGIILRKSGK